MKIKRIAVILCCASLSIMMFGTGLASATRVHSGARAHAPLFAHTASCSNFAWLAVPSAGTVLWIRTGPGTGYSTVGYYTHGTEFFAGCTGLGWLKIVPGEPFEGDYVNAAYAKDD
jgi:uncharacterized protein YraI